MDLDLAVPVQTVQHMPHLKAKLRPFKRFCSNQSNGYECPKGLFYSFECPKGLFSVLNVPRGYFTVIDFSLGVDTTDVYFQSCSFVLF